MKKLTTTSCVKNKSEIFCIVTLVLLRMERFKHVVVSFLKSKFAIITRSLEADLS
jgi:hypothetical protein